MNQELIMSVSGVRGIAGKTLTPSVLTRFAKAFGTFSGPGKIIVGRDTRASGEMLKHAVFLGLISCGCEVIDIGICPTPTIQLSVRVLKAKGGIAITASHNPIEWNGLKFISSNGMFMDETHAQRLFKIYQNGRFRKISCKELRREQVYPFAVHTHIKKILNYLNRDLIKKRKFKVAIDCCNGAGSVISPLILRKLGCSVIEVNTKPDGLFPRNPEPTPENLGVLSSVVKSKRADIGFAYDSDADRLSIVSEEGIAIGEEKTLALAVDYILSKKKGVVVTNVSTSMAIDDIVKKHGGRLVRTKVGEVNVSKSAKANKAVIAGEGNGGVIIPAIHYGRDGISATGLILQYLASSRKTISELVSLVPQYCIVKKKIEISREKAMSVLKKLKKEYKDARIDWTDGLKVLWKDSWIHFRASGTEPVMRIIAEAKTKERAEQLCNTGMKTVNKLKS